MSPTGRKIHEKAFQLGGLQAPVRIGILETPTGFEVNAIHGWPERMQRFFEKSLKNYLPKVTRIRAWRRDGKYSTNDPNIVNTILSAEYLYCGAGSPGYTVRNLRNTLAYEYMLKSWEKGTILSIGSATAVALSAFALPVYEIFKAGADLYWTHGLDFFSRWRMRLAVIPHWNNREGEDFDTSRCYMGIHRFELLADMLPKDIQILGIDEKTAAIFDAERETVTVNGLGAIHVIRNGSEYTYKAGTTLEFDQLRG